MIAGIPSKPKNLKVKPQIFDNLSTKDEEKTTICIRESFSVFMVEKICPYTELCCATGFIRISIKGIFLRRAKNSH